MLDDPLGRSPALDDPLGRSRALDDPLARSLDLEDPLARSNGVGDPLGRATDPDRSTTDLGTSFSPSMTERTACRGRRDRESLPWQASDLDDWLAGRERPVLVARVGGRRTRGERGRAHRGVDLPVRP